LQIPRQRGEIRPHALGKSTPQSPNTQPPAPPPGGGVGIFGEASFDFQEQGVSLPSKIWRLKKKT